MRTLTAAGNALYFGAQLGTCLVLGAITVRLGLPFLVRGVVIIVGVVVVSRVLATSGVLDRFAASPRGRTD